MKSLLVIFALAVLNCINVANGDCVAAAGTACETTYGDANTTSTELRCKALYVYGSCLVNAMCYEAGHKTAFESSAGSTACGDCTLKTGIACFNSDCSKVAAVEKCLNETNCDTDAFETAYNTLETRCNGCGTVTVSVLMMFLSTLLIFNKNY